MKNQIEYPLSQMYLLLCSEQISMGFIINNFMRQVLITVWKATASFMTSHCKWNHNQQTMSINSKPVKLPLKYLYCD